MLGREFAVTIFRNPLGLLLLAWALAACAAGQSASSPTVPDPTPPPKTKPKAAAKHVYTEEDLQRMPGGISVVGEADKPASATKVNAENKVEASRTPAQKRDQQAQGWRTRITEQELKIADLEAALNLFEHDNEMLVSDYEFKKRSQLPVCTTSAMVGLSCSENETETGRKYKAYIKEQAAKKAGLAAAAKELERMREVAIKEGILID